MTEVLIKRLSKNVELPKYETDGSSGMDLSANIPTDIKIDPGKTSIIPTGISLSIPKNFEIQIRPRSGLAAKSQVSVLNTPGTIDADYRGEIKVILINLGSNTFTIKKGARIAQMVLSPVIKVKFKEVENLDKTDRGSGGFGSTGMKWLMQMKLNDYKRFEKQIILKNIGVNGQKKILNSKVLIIGLGGLGCPLLTYLASSGVGKIGIVDHDKIEISNLNRQTLFNINDIGKYKVHRAKNVINKMNNKIRVKMFKKKLTKVNAGSIIKDFHMFVKIEV